MTILQVDGNDRGAPQFGDALCASPLPLDARSFDMANIPEGKADVAETFVNEYRHLTPKLPVQRPNKLTQTQGLRVGHN
ncbi:hypothetical protein ACEPPN_006455 [Leptodophora sp. 'Broadleaf-Isolate-01']